MSVIPLTIFVSLALAFLFVALFWRDQRRRVFGGAERESLLPLAEESRRVEGAAAPSAPAMPAGAPPVGPAPAVSSPGR